MNEYQVKVYFASGRITHNIGTLIKGDYNSTKLKFIFDDETGIKMFELLKPDGTTKRIKEIVNNEIILTDVDELGETVPLLTQDGTYIFEIAKYDGNSKLTSVKGKFKVKDEQVETADVPIDEQNKAALDDLINDVAKSLESSEQATQNATDQANYAKEQGDYAKQSGDIVNKANEEASSMISELEANIPIYTNEFNENASAKLGEYNSNHTNKMNEYDMNATQKENSYNENASDKVKEYNDNALLKETSYNTNAETKVIEYNSNATNKTKDFDDNADTKLGEYNTNHTAKLKEYNDNAGEKETSYNTNASTKLEEYNTNHTTKMNEYNTNAGTKVNEFNNNVDSIKNDLKDCYNNQLTNVVEGTSIHLEDSADAKIVELEIDGTLKQEVTTGENPSPSPDYPQDIKTIEGNLDLAISNEQLFNCRDIDLSTNNLYNSYTIDENDWITLNYTNNGNAPTYPMLCTYANSNLKTNTNYNVFCEFKSLNNSTGLMSIVANHDSYKPSQFKTYLNADLSSLADNTIVNGVCTTKDSFEQSSSMLRTYFTVNPGETCNITFRISVIEDTTITPQNFVHKPYKETKSTLTIPESEFAGKIDDTYKDKLRISYNEEDSKYHLYLDKFVGRYIPTGNEEWKYEDKYSRFYWSFREVLNAGGKSHRYEIKSTHFRYSSRGNDDGIGFISAKTLFLYNYAIKTLDDFKAFLSENNAQIYFPLAKPYTCDLGIIDMPRTYKGVTNIFLNANLETNMRVKYIQDTKTVLNNLQSQINDMKTLLSTSATSAMLLDNLQTDLESEVI